MQYTIIIYRNKSQKFLQFNFSKSLVLLNILWKINKLSDEYKNEDMGNYSIPQKINNGTIFDNGGENFKISSVVRIALMIEALSTEENN